MKDSYQIIISRKTYERLKKLLKQEEKKTAELEEEKKALQSAVEELERRVEKLSKDYSELVREKLLMEEYNTEIVTVNKGLLAQNGLLKRSLE